MSGVALTEPESLTPQQRANIIFNVAENSSAPDYLIADRTGLGLIPTIAALNEMTENGTLVKPYVNDYRVNTETQHQTYAEALPNVSVDRLMKLSTIGERPTAVYLFIYAQTPEKRFGPFRQAAKAEIYARMKRAERLDNN